MRSNMSATKVKSRRPHKPATPRKSQRTAQRLRQAALIEQLGPGLITGAADDDPSGIATYSQAGAQFGFNMLWTMVFTYPLMTAIQMISARIGRVTGLGLAANMARVFPRGVVTLLVVHGIKQFNIIIIFLSGVTPDKHFKISFFPWSEGFYQNKQVIRCFHEFTDKSVYFPLK